MIKGLRCNRGPFLRFYEISCPNCRGKLLPTQKGTHMTNENMRKRGSWAQPGTLNQSPSNANDRLLKILQAPQEVQSEIDRILEGRPSAQHSEPSTGPLLLGMSAAAKFIGCSRATLWRICRAGRLQKVEILPGSFRLRRADLLALAAGEGRPS